MDQMNHVARLVLQVFLKSGELVIVLLFKLDSMTSRCQKQARSLNEKRTEVGRRYENSRGMSSLVRFKARSYVRIPSSGGEGVSSLGADVG